MGLCRGLQIAPEAKGTNETSRKADDNTLTGHTRLFHVLTMIHPDVPLSPEFAGFDPGLGLPPFAGSLLLVLSYSTSFRAVCSLLSNSLVSLEVL